MKKLVAGIDIGGNHTACALVDESGKIYASSKFKTTDFHTFDSFVVKIKDTITELVNGMDLEYMPEVIGIGAPNGNYYTGEIENATNLAWKGKLPLAEKLSNLFDGTKVIVTNDANAAAIGEMMYGNAGDFKDFVVITLDAGLGSGIVIDGNIVYGHDGFAGELGHITITKEQKRQCGCGRYGCLETYASVKGIKRTVTELLGNCSSSSLAEIASKNELTVEQIITAAKQGDKTALKAFEITGTILGESIANLVAILSPEAVLFVGELSKAGDLLLTHVHKAMEQNLMPLWKGKIKLGTSAIDSELAPVLGAAALAIKELQKKYAFFERRKVI